MSGCTANYSRRRRSAPGLILGAAVCCVAGAAAAQTTRLPPDMVAKATGSGAYPTFADIPALPKNVRSSQAWRAAVINVREAGVTTQAQAAATPWGLAGSDAWAARARSEANPPAPVTSASDPETEALVAQMRARASQPPRRR